jgi:hypothetical protein
VTSPQDPWQQGGYQQYPQQQYPQQGGYPPQSPSSGGYPQQGGYQPYPQGGSPYGNPYAAPPVSAQEMSVMQRPVTVTIAFWIAIVMPILTTLLTGLSTYLSWDVVDRAIGSQDETAREAAGVGATIGIGLMAFIFLVLTGLWILFGIKMRAGRNWARITLTVFASIWELFAVIGLISSITGAAGSSLAGAEMTGNAVIVGYVQNGLVVLTMAAFIVLVFLKSSNWFFQAASRFG